MSKRHLHLIILYTAGKKRDHLQNALAAEPAFYQTLPPKRVIHSHRLVVQSEQHLPKLLPMHFTSESFKYLQGARASPWHQLLHGLDTSTSLLFPSVTRGTPGQILPEQPAVFTTSVERFERHHFAIKSFSLWEGLIWRTLQLLALCVGECGGFCFVFEQEIIF